MRSVPEISAPAGFAASARVHSPVPSAADQARLQSFADDVIEGLSGPVKTLPCKWFYDEAGSELFEAITQTAEYYPTRVEARLLKMLLPELLTRLADVTTMIEPGSGSSAKTRLLLGALPALRGYVPMDISAEFLQAAARRLAREFPALQITPLVADFSALSEDFPLEPGDQPLVFFPGSTVGNFAPAEAERLLARIRSAAGPRARLLIGVDMTQDAAALNAAYDDAQGITARFNLNLLARANRELGTDFDSARFVHQARFDPGLHRVEMHLVSTIAQTVRLGQHRFSFAEGESIHTENSYKYPVAEFERVTAAAGWRLISSWRDSVESGFTVQLLTA